MTHKEMTRKVFWSALVIPLALMMAPASAEVPMPPLAGGSGAPSDLWITAAIEATMERDGRLDRDRIAVSTVNGRVMLTGTVLTDFEWAHAERLAGGVPGVHAIDNRLRIEAARDRDKALAAEVRTAILQHPLLAVSHLSVTADEGAVQIMGIAAEPEHKDLIDRLVSFIPNVRAVDNRVIVPSAV